MSSPYNSSIPGRAFWFSQSPVTVSTTELIVTDMPDNYRSGTFYIEFYDASGNPVTPTAGTMDITSSPLGKTFMRNHEDRLFYAVPDRPVVFSGMMTACKVKLNAIAGVVTWRAAIWRS